MAKTLCKREEEKIYDNPKYVCKKCGRKAKKEEKLCKPRQLGEK